MIKRWINISKEISAGQNWDKLFKGRSVDQTLDERRRQAQLGVPHSEIQVELDLITQLGPSNTQKKQSVASSCKLPLHPTPCHQKSPCRLSTSYLLTIYMVNFKLHLYFPGWVGWLRRLCGGLVAEAMWWVVIIKHKAKHSSTGTGLANLN